LDAARRPFIHSQPKRAKAQVMLLLPAILAMPLLLWLALPDRWQPALPWIVLGALVLALAIWAARVAADSRRMRRSPSRPDHVWHEGVRAQEFSTRLTIYLRDRGWRVATKIMDDRRVQIGIDKDKRSAMLLCLAPGAIIGPADIGHVAAWRDGAPGRSGAIVSDGKRPDTQLLPSKDAEIFFLGYEEIEDLDLLFWTGV
jgi:hypothetical protein